MTIFRIPVMRIHDKLLNIEEDHRLITLRKWVEKTINKQRYNWGIRGKGYSVKFDLARQWYPIFIFTNRWLADAFVEHLGKFFRKKENRERQKFF